MRWIKNKTNATVNFIDYGKGGTSSITALQLYVDTIPSDNLKRLDLVVLLDYSVNDAASIGKENDPGRHHALEYSVEWLIRRLLARFSNPVIVLLAGKPSWNQYNQYTSVYEKLARYYSIPFWSYDNVAKSTALMAKSYASLLRWLDNSVTLAAGHPSWPVHLFTADLYAAIIEEEFSRCPPRTITNSYTEMKQEPLPALPAPITSPDGIYFCDLNATAFLQISAEDFYHGRSHTGHYSGGWEVVEDRKNKWGWMDEFAHDNLYHVGVSSTPPKHRSLVFRLQDNGRLFTSHSHKDYSNSSEDTRDVLIRVAFLKTNNNTGQFDIYLCGKFLQSIDTCWGDPSIKVSTTEISFIRLERGVFLSECNHIQTLTLEFRHVWMDYDVNSNSTRDTGCYRHYQKVKLIDVTVCTAAHLS